MSLELSVSSADETARYLRSHGFDVEGPSGGTITPEGIIETLPELTKGVRIEFFEKPKSS